MKVFGIGLSKTGTTSLAHALDILGYKTKDYPGLIHYSPGDLSSIDASLVDAYDALTDTPIPSFYRELDAKYPDAKFILTVRDAENWLKSCKKQFTQKLADKQNEAHNRLFMDLYGSTVYDERKFRAGYEKFVNGVQEYFKGRTGKLLVMNVAAGDGWETLCSFLNQPIPQLPFPKANVTQIRWLRVEDLVNIAREAGQKVLRLHNVLSAHSSSQEANGLSWPGQSLVPFERAVLKLCGGRRLGLARATRAAQRVVVRRLSKLNPDIPVVSRTSHAVPYAIRSKWNHFWLIDPLDGEDGFASQAGEFTINIALIEDQQPILGVVYAPISGRIYYASAGKGAFKIESSRQPVRLRVRGAGGVVSAPPHGKNLTIGSQAAERTSRSASKALTLCLLSEDVRGVGQDMHGCMEWQSAAAHVVANALGKKVRIGNGDEELNYNKKDWSTEWITLI